MGLARLDGRTCLVTGATSGIGQETARGLAGLGAHVVIVGRDRERAESARKAIVEKSGNPRVDVLLADLSSLAGIRGLADEFLATYPALHVLVNNAGTVELKRTTTVDGFEKTFAVNHLAYFLLDEPAAAATARECAGSHRERRLRGAPHGADRSRRSPEREALRGDARLRHVEASEHPVHGRARGAPRGLRRDGQLPAPGRRQHGARKAQRRAGRSC